MRVLHIMSGFGGGISSFIFNKANALADQAVTFDVVTYDDCTSEFISAIQSTGGDVYLLKNPKKEGWKAFIASFEAIFQHFHYDVIHCHIKGYRVIPYAIIAKKYVNRFYIHAHDTSATEKMSFLARIVAKMNQKINRHLSEAFLGCSLLANEAVFGVNSTEQQIIIPNSIDVKRFLRANEQILSEKKKLRTKFSIKENERVIGQIGRLKRVKNIEFTLKLARIIKKENLPFKILIAGDGELALQLKEQVFKDETDEIITFLGRIEPIETIMPIFDVMILPSLYEGLPTVVVEAQAMGIPSILNTTITKEVDFGMNLVSYISVDSPNQWLEQIDKAANQEILNYKKRSEIIESFYFTNELSAKLYLDFLNQDITDFKIGRGF